MNKISSALLALSLLSTASLTFAMEPMDKSGAMEKDAMSKDAMKKEPMAKEGVMMKVEPKKMKRQKDKMEQGGSMAMEPKK
ncbi:hypothetical protein SCT_2039 [Sulfuricella sp. T08]|uniref:hypothetical protein n=1 Tax=Sulfuricella sp. T08 TaxID=1632857 RepID=UPI000617995A|nr:hypothetical protein [Sulfuricella sp. T08]GAO36630.1 hypothetical protein SCT_2039 [Sulfuricella sp. T08]